MNKCPYCDNKIKEEVGFWRGRERIFVPCFQNQVVIRTTCLSCNRFLGYRPTEEEALRLKKIGRRQ